MISEHIYVRSLLTIQVTLDVTEIEYNLRENILVKLKLLVANKCIEEGYVSPINIHICEISFGRMNHTSSIVYHVVYECNICHPVEGMQFIVKVKTITKAGIHAHYMDSDGHIPVTVFIARDYIDNDDSDGKITQFPSIKENDNILVKIIGIRYELNDDNICAIASILQVQSKIR